jgi:nucleotide-binding universal stress UspA family protein
VAAESSVFVQLRELGSEIAERSGAEVEPVALYGNAAIEILAEAQARGAHLIVLGARHHSVFDSIPWDRASSRVLAQARCPVLTLHEWEDTSGEFPSNV